MQDLGYAHGWELATQFDGTPKSALKTKQVKTKKTKVLAPVSSPFGRYTFGDGTGGSEDYLGRIGAPMCEHHAFELGYTGATSMPHCGPNPIADEQTSRSAPDLVLPLTRSGP